MVRGEMGDGRGGRRGMEAMARSEVWSRESLGRRGGKERTRMAPFRHWGADHEDLGPVLPS